MALEAEQVLVEALAKKGVSLTTEGAADRFLGRSLGSLADAVQSEFGVEIDPPFLAGMREVLYTRFRAELKPLLFLLIPLMQQAITSQH